MERSYTEDRDFEKIEFAAARWTGGDYDNCTFTACNFAGADLSGTSFADCTFRGCNLATAKLVKTALRDTSFIECKLTGLHFEDCSDFLFTPRFEGCTLDLSSFFGMKLKKMIFKNCSLREVDFTGTDLGGAVLDRCDLDRALFDHTVLEKADLRTAYHYSIDPEKNRLKKARFSVAGIMGLLDKYDIEVE
jgi:fluoroquinolone resistance protein